MVLISKGGEGMLHEESKEKIQRLKEIVAGSDNIVFFWWSRCVYREWNT